MGDSVSVFVDNKTCKGRELVARTTATLVAVWVVYVPVVCVGKEEPIIKTESKQNDEQTLTCCCPCCFVPSSVLYAHA